jgi:hypothetical protein
VDDCCFIGVELVTCRGVELMCKGLWGGNSLGWDARPSRGPYQTETEVSWNDIQQR